MIHLGDITKISGYDAPPVDCIIGGSPCQDLSVAGKRAGLAGQRSGLFMEQIRIVKEMRDADRLRGRAGQLVRPRFMVWENVPGAFSSNHGEDFRAVLEETIRIAEPEAPDIPLPSKGGWPLADAWYGDGWSVAYRVLDAQFWGVPQRRRRIALVADFGGQSAPEILFERVGVSWNTPEGQETGQAVAGGAGQRLGETDTEGGVRCLTPWDTQSARVYGEDGAWHSLNANENGGMSRDSVLTMRVRCGCEGGGKGALIQEDKSGTLAFNNDQVLFYAFTQNQRNEVRDLHDVAGSLAAEPGMKQQTFVCAGFKAGNGPKANGIGYEPEKAPTLSAANSGTNQVPAVICLQGNAVDRNAGQNGSGISQEPMFTLNATDRHAVLYENHPADSRVTGPHDVCPTCSARWGTGGNNTPLVMDSEKKTYQDVTGSLCANSHPGGVTGQDAFNDMLITSPVAAVDCRNGVENAEVNGTLQAKSTGGQSLNLNNVVREAGTVRRLTPVECERLQGFPDGWTDIGDWTDEKGKVHKTSDAARYKALGNSIALPPWKWVLKRLCAMYERDATLGSLFDGVGGFSLIWERLNGPGTCLFASEIEPFCIAVTKKRFGGSQ